MVGTLYIVGAPAGNPDDLTQRALRILEEVDLVAAVDTGDARQLLTRHAIATPLVAAGRDVALEGLHRGDVALLAPGWSTGLSSTGHQVVCSALECGFAVVSVPGSCLPLTALVLSGLPADSFVYVGTLPLGTTARRDLLASVAAERRTLVVIESFQRLSSGVGELYAALGDRPLIVVAAFEEGVEVIWRGGLEEAASRPATLPAAGPCVLVVGGAPGQIDRWDEERLRAEIQERLAQAHGAKEISRHLAAESGWPRREVYRLTVELAQQNAGS
jgi:16S rRNA (cytidine1402-2'-O)-methyltransferase